MLFMKHAENVLEEACDANSIYVIP